MSWVLIPGYRYEYRINENGEIRRKDRQGRWRGVNYNMRPGGFPSVRLIRTDGRCAFLSVSRLMADAFMGGVAPDEQIHRKNGVRMDCSLWNLEKLPRRGAQTWQKGRRKTVFRVNSHGEITDVYPSIREAARDNHVTDYTMSRWCHHRVNMPTASDCDFWFEEEWNSDAWKASLRKRGLADALLRGAKSRPVFKVSRQGEIVAAYPSVQAAADGNYTNTNTIRARCRHRLMDPYGLDGCDYWYQDDFTPKAWKNFQEVIARRRDARYREQPRQVCRLDDSGAVDAVYTSMNAARLANPGITYYQVKLQCRAPEQFERVRFCFLDTRPAAETAAFSNGPTGADARKEESEGAAT